MPLERLGDAPLVAEPQNTKPFFTLKLLAIVAVLAILLQYVFLLGMSLFSESGRIVCTNWHGGASDCSMGAALIGNIYNVAFLNVATAGIAYVVAVFAAFFCYILYVALVPPAIARSKVVWVALLLGFLVLIGLRSLGTAAVRTDAGARIILKEKKIESLQGGKGGGTVVDPMTIPGNQ